MTEPVALRGADAATLRQILAGLQTLIVEVRGLRADLHRKADAAPTLLAALADEFGAGGRFTTAGVLALADDDPHGALAVALADVVDLNALPRSRATALGALLAKLPELEVVTRSPGVAVYRLRTLAG